MSAGLGTSPSLSSLVLVALVLLLNLGLRGGDALPTVSHQTRVDYDSTGYEIEKNGKAHYRIARRTVIADEKSADEATITLFESDLIEIKKFEARVLDSLGEELNTYEKDDLLEQCGFGGSYMLYRDACYYMRSFRNVETPFVVEFEVSYEIDSEYSVHWPLFVVQREIPVRRTAYTVMAPSDFEFKTSVVGNIPAPISFEAEKEQHWKWVVEDVKAFESEPHMPPHSLYSYSIRFVPKKFRIGDHRFDASSWQTLSASYWEMIKDQFRSSDEQNELISRIFSDSIPLATATSALHDTLSSRSRYIAVSIGIGGWLPHSSEETFDKRYGDCKYLSTMYSSMLVEAGVAARPALIQTMDEGRMGWEIPMLSGFNHVILCYLNDTDTVWVDPTCFDCSPGDLPWTVESTTALVVDQADGDLVLTQGSKAVENSVTRRSRILPALSSGGRVEMSIDCRGNAAHGLLSLSRELKNEELFEKLRDFSLIGDKLSFDPNVNSQRLGDYSNFGISFGAVDRQLTISLPDKLYVDFSFIPALRPAELVSLDERNYPLDLVYPRSLYDTCTVVLPEKFSIATLPEPRAWTNSIGSVTIDFEATDTTVIVARTKLVNRYLIDETDFAAFAEFVDSCESILGNPLMLVPRTDSNAVQSATEP